MPKKQPQLAKLTRPRLYKAVARERLFALMDQKREHPVIWIVGPPGAGKTTLAASYLEEAGLPAIWYQIDAGDSDPATFFLYLKQAVEAAARRKARPLPLFTPEYLSDLPGFARRFFRDVFARLAGEVLIVFDNYHEITPDSTLHAAIAAALAEIPPGANIMVLSRTDPPPGYAPSIVNQAVAVVSWDDLKLTAEEAQAIARSRGIQDVRVANELHAQCDGWMAGLTLMLERSKGGMAMRRAARAETLETVFDYFGSVLFEQASTEAREVMMCTALLPHVTRSLAETVASSENPIRHVDALYRRHLFTSRISGETDTYRYHALFHAFLKARAIVSLPRAERQVLARRAASKAEAEGHVEDAFAILTEAEQWPDAARIAVAHAPALVNQGRWKTLTEWGQRIPVGQAERTPWLGYWVGRSQIAVQPVAARRPLEAAYGRFCDRDDKRGQLLCAVAILDALYFQFTDFTQMDPWIARVVDLLEQGVILPDKEEQLRIYAAVMMGATYRAPKHAMLEKCVSCVKSLILEDLASNLKVTVASMLHAFGNMAVDVEAEDLATRVAGPLLAKPELTGGVAMFYLAHEGYTHYVHGRYRQSLECFDRSDDVAAEHGLQAPVVAITWRGLTERRAGLINQAEASLRSITRGGGSAAGYVVALVELLKGSIAFARGEAKSASATLQGAYALSLMRGSYNGSMLIGLVAANFTIAAGDAKAARKLLDQLDAHVDGSYAENYVGAIRLNQAWVAHREGALASRDRLLQECLGRAVDARQRLRLRWYGNALSDLLPVALRAGFHADMAARLVKEFDVPPADEAPENWPWPVKIYTLGRFELLIDGKPAQFSRKAPKKVLLLLKAIIALGVREVPEQTLIDALWPDEEGDAAARSLTATLHRLRKLLGYGGAIRQAGGALSLNELVCWVDAVDFESGLNRDGNGELRDEALQPYRGAFLVHEEAAWAVAARERLRAKFVQAIGTRSADLEASGCYAQAVELYSRGIEADSLIETFYQGLMRCYDRLDRRTEALSTYRRLREILSVTLGVSPSSTTRRLFETLQSS